MGHSMGGVVATSLLPHTDISTIITMSTPHTVPPARFDRRIDSIYATNYKTLMDDFTPILSLCGGATDLQVLSEFCTLPSQDSLFDPPYRRTVYTSALEGSWTGVGHREMVWCHQVRWRVARAALELGLAQTPTDRGVILDTWLRDGHILPPRLDINQQPIMLQDGFYTALPPGLNLVLKDPTASHMYTLPAPEAPLGTYTRFVLYVSHGSVQSVSPYHPYPMRGSVYHCTDQTCRPLRPQVLKLIPSTITGRSWPVPDEGSDESEGVVVFEADIVTSPRDHFAVRVDDADGHGWVVGGFVSPEAVKQDTSLFGESKPLMNGTLLT